MTFPCVILHFTFYISVGPFFFMAHGTFNWSTIQIVPPFKLFPHSTGPQIQDNLLSKSLGVLWTPFFVSWLPLFCLHNYWTLNNPHAGIPCMTHRSKQKLFIWLITLKRCSSRCCIILVTMLYYSLKGCWPGSCVIYLHSLETIRWHFLCATSLRETTTTDGDTREHV